MDKCWRDNQDCCGAKRDLKLQCAFEEMRLAFN